MHAAEYVRPKLDPSLAVTDLSASAIENARRAEPELTERVYCINRGRKPLEATFNSRHLMLPAGYQGTDAPPRLFEIEYEAAKHFQRRLIVPGTKNIEMNTWVSWIAILGVDAPEECEPFTDEQMRYYGEKVEAIDRSAMGLPSDRDVQYQRVTSVQARTFNGGGRLAGGKPGVDITVGQATPEAQEAARHILDTNEFSAAREAEVEAATEGYARPADAPAPEPLSAPMRRRR